jgi:hypothetical protein
LGTWIGLFGNIGYFREVEGSIHLIKHSWRIALMERSVEQLDFLEVDQTVQIHGELQLSQSWNFSKLSGRL